MSLEVVRSSLGGNSVASEIAELHGQLQESFQRDEIAVEKLDSIVKILKARSSMKGLPATTIPAPTPSTMRERLLEEEIASLRAEIHGTQILLIQNEQLESELARLCGELQEVTQGVMYRGYLFKWRERDISYASKWVRRFFVLHGNKLSYYASERDDRPRRTIDMTKCVVRDEGTKKQGLYHVFAVYYSDAHVRSILRGEFRGDVDVGTTAAEVLIRLSTQTRGDALQWMSMLEMASVAVAGERQPEEEIREATAAAAAVSSDSGRRRRVLGGGGGDGGGEEDCMPSFALPLGPRLRSISTEAPLDHTDPDLLVGVDFSPAGTTPRLMKVLSAQEVSLSLASAAASAAAGGGGGAGAAAGTGAGALNIDLPLSPHTLSRVKNSHAALQQAGRMHSRRSFTCSADSQRIEGGEGRVPGGSGDGDGDGDGVKGVKGTSERGLKSSGLESTSSTVPRKAFEPSSFPGSKAIHVERRVSPLSAEAKPHDQNFRGFLHLAMIIVVVQNFRMIFENLLKYGWVVTSIPVPKLFSFSFTGQGQGQGDGEEDFDIDLDPVPSFFSSIRVWDWLPCSFSSTGHDSCPIPDGAVPTTVPSTEESHDLDGILSSSSSSSNSSSIGTESSASTLTAEGLGLVILSFVLTVGLTMLVELGASKALKMYARASTSGTAGTAGVVDGAAAPISLLPDRIDSIVLVLHYILGTLNVIGPIWWVWTTSSHPIPSMLYLGQAIVLWLKMISYAHVNRDSRKVMRKRIEMLGSKAIASLENVDGDRGNRSGSGNGNGNDGTVEGTVKEVRDMANMAKDKDRKMMLESTRNSFSAMRDLEEPFVQYPRNLTVSHIAYFCIAPTLCYQLNYPRSPSIRARYLVTIVGRLVVVAGLILFFVEQHIGKALGHGGEPGITMERLLLLSIPNTYVWLLGFYWFFHLWLNLCAELTRFGDRLFYKEWWNARTIETYWRHWNLPVHHWMLRHLYYPTLRLGVSKAVATGIVFFFSAVLHEVIISVPFRHISGHAFAGMLSQAPLVFVTKWLDKYFDNPLLGNAMFWIVFCVIGQPIGILMFYSSLWTATNAGLV